jgi:hypothetical protein
VSVLSKCDLIADKDKVDDFLEPDAYSLLRSMESESHGHMRPLNEAIAELVEEYSMVAFAPLDISNEDSIEAVLSMIDMAMQYGEDLEPRDDPDAPQE